MGGGKKSARSKQSISFVDEGCVSFQNKSLSVVGLGVWGAKGLGEKWRTGPAYHCRRGRFLELGEFVGP
jgi:hypothetical protein